MSPDQLHTFYWQPLPCLVFTELEELDDQEAGLLAGDEGSLCWVGGGGGLCLVLVVSAGLRTLNPLPAVRVDDLELQRKTSCRRVLSSLVVSRHSVGDPGGAIELFSLTGRVPVSFHVGHTPQDRGILHCYSCSWMWTVKINVKMLVHSLFKPWYSSWWDIG